MQNWFAHVYPLGDVMAISLAGFVGALETTQIPRQLAVVLGWRLGPCFFDIAIGASMVPCLTGSCLRSLPALACTWSLLR